MENTLNRYGPLVGRLLIAFIFVYSGFGKVTGFDGTVGYIAIAAIIVELGGGLLLIAGWKTRWAAAAMLIFTGMAALLFHNFWAVPADQAQNQMIHFMKNISIMGGLLFVVVHGSGSISVRDDSRAAQA